MKNLLLKAEKLPAFWMGAFLACLFSFFYWISIYNIPFEQMEGIARGWNLASQMSWPDFFYYLLRPVSTALTSSGQHLIDVRVSESMIQKVLYIFWGESLPALRVMNIAAAFILILLYFRLLLNLTRNKIASFLAVFFLFATPAYLWVMMEYGDYAPTDQVFLLTYFFLLFHVFTAAASETKNKFPFALKILALWFWGMVTINAKEPNKLLVPAVSWALLLINPGFNLFCNQKKLKRLLSIAGCVLVLSLPLVLVEFKGVNPMKLSWSGPFHQFFFQPNGWEDEKRMCLFTLERVLPVSVLANFGFFLCWPLLILLVLRLLRVFKNTPEPQPKPVISTPLFLAVWFFVSTAFYIFQDSDTFFRYLSWSLMPFTAVCAVFLTDTLRRMSPKTKALTALLLCGLVSYKIADNFQHSLFFRRQLEKIWISKWAFQQKVYEDSQGIEKASLFKLYDFWSYDPFAIEQFPYMPPANVQADTLETPAFKAKLDKMKKMYFVSYAEITKPGVTPLAKIDVDRLSVLSAMRSNRKKKQPSYYHLYRIDAQP